MNVTANPLVQLMASGAGQMPSAPQAATQKREESSFDRLMRDKSQAPSGERTAQTESDSNALAENDSGQPAKGAQETASDEQYALAAALSAPVAGIFMPIQVIVDLQEQPQETLLPVAAAQAQPVDASVQLCETAKPLGLPVEQAVLPELRPQQAQDTPLAAQQTVEGGTQQEALSVIPKAGDAADTAMLSDADTKDQPDTLAPETTQKPVFDAVQSAPVKVGDAAPVDAEASDLDVQLAKRLDGAVQRGESQIAVRLTPENLGMVQVQLTRSSDGSLSVVLSAASEKALNLLERHSAGLQSLLMANTQAPVKIEVQHSGESQQTQQNPLNQDGGGRGGHQGSRQQAREQQTQDFMQQLRLGLVDLGGANGKEVTQDELYG